MLLVKLFRSLDLNHCKFRLTGELAKHPPSNSLISFLPVSSLILQLGAVIGFQVMALKSIQGQAEWFVAFDKTNPTYNGTNHTGYYAEIFGTPSEVRIILPPVTSLTGFRNAADDVTGGEQRSNSWIYFVHYQTLLDVYSALGSFLSFVRGKRF